MNDIETEIQSIMSRATPVNDNLHSAGAATAEAENTTPVSDGSGNIVNNSINISGNKNFVFTSHGTSLAVGMLLLVLVITLIFF